MGGQGNFSDSRLGIEVTHSPDMVASKLPYFHDGNAATLMDVVAHCNRARTLGLTAEQQRELIEYLKSL